ncbi:MAG: hypothetical protein NTW91_08370 [Verrucomicrobia bacterium]|nr:hypothetical protein [Verrucomicrobiota bacterium]
MKIQTYFYHKKLNTYVTAKSLGDIPQDIQKQFGGLSFFKELDLNLSNPPLIAFDKNAAIADIEKHGFHISAIETRCEEKEGK